MDFRLRRAESVDRDAVIAVESRSTPRLRYVEEVWDEFQADPAGELSVVEAAGVLTGFGKYTRLPDGSAWLETLRVAPEWQGRGVGKRLYEHWLELAKRHRAPALRMYTGTGNKASKGLAERFGFAVAGVFHEARRPGPFEVPDRPPAFQRIRAPTEAEALLMPLREAWNGFLVLNRTYYAYGPALCRHLAERGDLYHDPSSGSVLAMGARFMPRDALHIGAISGDLDAGLAFAEAAASERGVGRIQIQFPPAAQDVRASLAAHGYTAGGGDFIVMERREAAEPAAATDRSGG